MHLAFCLFSKDGTHPLWWLHLVYKTRCICVSAIFLRYKVDWSRVWALGRSYNFVSTRCFYLRFQLFSQASENFVRPQANAFAVPRIYRLFNSISPIKFIVIKCKHFSNLPVCLHCCVLIFDILEIFIIRQYFYMLPF